MVELLLSLLVVVVLAAAVCAYAAAFFVLPFLVTVDRAGAHGTSTTRSGAAALLGALLGAGVLAACQAAGGLQGLLVGAVLAAVLSWGVPLAFLALGAAPTVGGRPGARQR